MHKHMQKHLFDRDIFHFNITLSSSEKTKNKKKNVSIPWTS